MLIFLFLGKGDFIKLMMFFFSSSESSSSKPSSSESPSSESPSSESLLLICMEKKVNYKLNYNISF